MVTLEAYGDIGEIVASITTNEVCFCLLPF
ncbi:hypothetical protein BE22_0076 [Staphylococcus phage vB_SepS_BE22]|nr:hypothetical protein BE22_0076 [Staphylococcus phage vB_SepS_BE22]